MENIFESRRDVENAMLIIKEWQENHSDDSKAEYAKELFNKLEVLHLSW